MKKAVWIFAALVVLAFAGIGDVYAQEQVYICAPGEVETPPARPDMNKDTQGIAWQWVWGPQKCWRNQVVTFNDATTGQITQEMMTWAKNQPIPTRNGRFLYESYSYTDLFPKDGRKKAAVTSTAMTPAPAKALAATTPLPKVEQPAPPPADADTQTQLNAIRGQLAELKSEKADKPTPAAKVAPKPAAKPAAKKAPAVNPLAKELEACKKKVEELEVERESCRDELKVANHNSTVVDSQLTKVNADLTAANEKLAAAKSSCDTAVQNAKALAKAEGKAEVAKELFPRDAVIFWGIVGLVIGFLACFFIMPAIARYRARRGAAAPRDGE